MAERLESTESELTSHTQTIASLRDDVITAKDSTHSAIQESATHKQQAAKLLVQKEGLKEQHDLLIRQVRSQHSRGGISVLKNPPKV